jgi:DNA-binding response OmpR family regulator
MTNPPDDKPWRQRALLVAPDPVTRKVCCETLRSANFTVVYSTDSGAGAVTLATREHPDVILLSQQLSDVPASEAVKWFRSNKELASTPIIILGTRTEDDMHADSWTILLPRPVTPARLRQALGDSPRRTRASDATTLAAAHTRSV